MLISDRLMTAPEHLRPAQAGPPEGPSRLQSLCADIREAAATPLPGREQRVAQVLAPYLGCSDLLDTGSCRCAPDRYVRHLLDTGPEHTVLALVWRPRQMSAVHGHHTWCAFGLHTGWMVESDFTLVDGKAVPLSCAQRPAGSISHSPPDPARIHRLANLGLETAVSIHVYGAPYDRIGEDVNRIWAE